MATVTAKATGNWSAGSTWDTDPNLPAAGDTVDCAAYTVTIDQNVTVVALINSSTGGFTCSSARTIAANITATGKTVLTCTHTSGTTYITGTIQGGSSSLAYGVYIAGAGGQTNISTSGGITGGSATNAHGVHVGVIATLNVSGNCTGGSGAASGVNNNASGTITITGSVTGGSNASGSAFGVRNGSSGTVTVTQNATGGSTQGCYGIFNNGTGTASCNTAIGGTHPSTPGLFGNASGGMTTFKIAQHSTSTAFPVGGFVKMEYDQDVNYMRVQRSDTSADVDLSNDYPAASDVKLNTVYKLGGLTGSMAAGGGSRPYQVYGLEELH